jgi:hypothetical protein
VQILRVGGRFTPFELTGPQRLNEHFQILAGEEQTVRQLQAREVAIKESSPMWIRESENVHWNWIAIFSYTASLAVSLAIWRGLFLAVERLVRLGS